MPMYFEWQSVIMPSGRAIDFEQVRLFENKLGFHLPHEYRKFILTWNGGNVFFEHKIYVSALSCDISINCFWPLTEKKPSIGVKEYRDAQECNRLGVRQSIAIGDDLGTGFFFLILDGRERGAVYFTFKDDVQMCEGDWYLSDVRIPSYMVKVSSTFTNLGRLILSSQ